MFVAIDVAPSGQVSWTYQIEAFRKAFGADGALLLRSNQGGWTAAVRARVGELSKTDRSGKFRLTRPAKPATDE